MRVVLVALMLVAALLVGCSDPSEGKYGEELFGTTCSHCHGRDLAGGVGPPLGRGSGAASLTDEQITGVVSVGPGAMPSFASRLTEDQTESLVDYLRERQSS